MNGATESTAVVVLRSGIAKCALPIAVVRDVMSPDVLTRVPQGPDALLGLTNHRGRIVPVYDFSLLIGQHRSASKDAIAVVCARGKRLAAFAVDDVEYVGPAAGDAEAQPKPIDVFELLETPSAQAAQGETL